MSSSSPALRRSLLALGLSAGLALVCTPALANHFGGGGGGGHSVGHSSGGGGHSGGASRGFAGTRGGAMMRGGSPAHFSATPGRAYGGGFGVASRGYAGPGGYRGYGGGHWRGGGYWHGGGYWRGGLWYGGFLAALPLYYDMFWWGGVPYYYANDAYYVWSDSLNGYTSVPPPGDQPPAAADQDPAVANSDLIVYPKNGQSPDQQARDRYECGHWAATQSGFNPEQPGQPGSAPAAGSDQYLRAESACLEGRGYTVK